MPLDWRREWPFWAMLAGMFLLAAVRWPALPEELPVHWGAGGEPDRYGGKFEALLLLPGLSVGIYFLLLALPYVDPGRANYLSFTGAYYVIRLGIIAFFAGMYVVIHVQYARGDAIVLERIVPVMVGALFILLGGVMGKVRPNWFVGMRTPWTLSSKRAWTRTHRLSGWLFVAAGVVVIVVALVQPDWVYAVIIGTAVAVGVVGVAYSYFAWRSDPDRVSPAGTTPAER